MQWGIFNDESADWTEGEALESDFYSREDANAALARYPEDENLVVHEVEAAEEDDGDMDCNTCGGGGCPECCPEIEEDE